MTGTRLWIANDFFTSFSQQLLTPFDLFIWPSFPSRVYNVARSPRSLNLISSLVALLACWGVAQAKAEIMEDFQVNTDISVSTGASRQPLLRFL